MASIEKILLLLNILNIVFTFMIFAISESMIEYYIPLFLYFFAFFLFSLINKLNNIVFFSRTFFIGAIGYWPIFIKMIDINAYFSTYEKSSQGIETVFKAFLAVNLALAGNEIGLFLGKYINIKKIIANRTVAIHSYTNRNYLSLLFYLSIIVVFIVAELTIESAGPTVFQAYYASQAKGQLLGNLQAIGLIGIFSIFLVVNKEKKFLGKFIFFLAFSYFIVWSMLLRGMRIDSITCVFGLYVIYFLSKNKHPIFEKRHIVLAFLLIVSLEVWAVLRSGLVNNEFNVMTSLEHILKGISASNAHDAKTYHGGTISPISNTMTNIIYLIDMDKMDYYYGKTILEFLPRTPPAFIYPDRPKDYAWIFTEYNMIAGGGFYELAEAYMNFGLLGAFIFPLLLTFFISASYWRVFYSQSIFNYFIFFSFLASWFRGNWYQIFAFYKNFVTAMILYFVFIIIFELLTSYNKKQIE